MPAFDLARALSAAALALAIGAAAPIARADGARAPDAAQIRKAAEQFDLGAAALKRGDFEAAASHFEAADAAAPSAEALRQAIRARTEASQGSRAATLAALAIERYPSDHKLVKLARETIEKFQPLVHKVSVSCVSPCLLAAGTRSIPGEANTRWVVFLDPGKVTLSASFFGGSANVAREIEAKAGGSGELRFDPEEKKGPVVTPPPVVDEPKKQPVDEAKKQPVDEPPKDEPAAAKGISPAFFAVGMVATGALGATTIWSGVDTLKNPGKDAVKAGCVGLGESCPLYQEGRKKQLRTNALIGATAGTAAITVVLAIFTNFKGKPKADDKKAAAFSIVPSAPAEGFGLGAQGVF